jgi:hypothetical protein
MGFGAAGKGIASFAQQVRGLQGWLAAGGESISAFSAGLRVLGVGMSGAAIGAGAVILGFAAVAAFFLTKHHQAVQQARADVDELVKSLGAAADAGPAAARRLADDLVSRASSALSQIRSEFAGSRFGDEEWFGNAKERVLAVTEIERMAEKVDELKESARGLTGEQRRQTLAQADLVGATRQAAISQALYGANSEQARLAEQKRREALRGLIQETKGQGDADRDGAGATRDSGDAADEAGKSVRQLARERRRAADAAREQRDAELGLVGGFLDVQSSLYGARDATRDYRNAQAEVARLERAGKKGTDEHTEALRELRDARLGSVEAQFSLKQSVVDYYTTLREGGATQEEALARLERFGARAGLSKGEVDKLIGSVKGILGDLAEWPDKKRTRVDLENAEAVKAAIRSITDALDLIPNIIPVNVNVTGGRIPGSQLAGVAAGGITQGPTVLVGESRERTFAGPGSEAVIPLNDRGIAILARAVAMGQRMAGPREGSAAAGPFTFNFLMDGETFAIMTTNHQRNQNIVLPKRGNG